jgi:hypothetical protein
MTDPYIVSWGPTTKQIAKFLLYRRKEVKESAMELDVIYTL